MVRADDFSAEMKRWRQPRRGPGAGGAAPRQPPTTPRLCRGVFGLCFIFLNFFFFYLPVAKLKITFLRRWREWEQPGRGSPRPPPGALLH